MRAARVGLDQATQAATQVQVDSEEHAEAEPELEPKGGFTKPGLLGEAGRWLLVALAYSVAGCGLWAAMFWVLVQYYMYTYCT